MTERSGASAGRVDRRGEPSHHSTGPHDLPDPRSTASLVGLCVTAVVLCWLLISGDFAVVAGCVVVATLVYRDDPGRPAAVGSALLLVAAAVLTLVEVPLGSDEPTLGFALSRPWAGQAANVAGALLAVAVVMFAVVERPAAAARRWVPPTPAVDRWRDGVRRLGEARSWLGPAAAIGMVALVVRWWASPPPLASSAGALADQIRRGAGFRVVIDGHWVPVSDHGPLAPVIVALSPIAPRWLVLAASLGLVGAVTAVARRMAGRRAALVAGAVAAVAPSLWDQSLPVTVAGLALTVAVLVADPGRLDVRRAAAAGVVIGLAGLARPEALMALAVFVVWVVVASRAPHRGWWAVVMGGAAGLAALLWFGPAGPGSLSDRTIGAWTSWVVEPVGPGRLGAPAALAGGAVLVLAAVVAVARQPRDWLGRGRRWLPVVVLPGLAVALALWSPGAREPLTWAAGLAAVMVGVGFADRVPPGWVGEGRRPAEPSGRRGEHDAGVLAAETD